MAIGHILLHSLKNLLTDLSFKAENYCQSRGFISSFNLSIEMELPTLKKQDFFKKT
jgi:hypothetical protein